MFDIGWSELVILGVMALIVVGPKDLPVLLRTLGRYLGVIRKQASEFRAQFDEALRETEIDQIRQDMAGIKQDVASTMHEATRQVERDLDTGKIDPSVEATVEKKSASGEADEVSLGDEDEEVVVPIEDPEPPETVETALNEPKPVAKGSAETSGV